MNVSKTIPAEQLAKFANAKFGNGSQNANPIKLHMEALIAVSTSQGKQVKTFGNEKVIQELFELDGYWITRTTEPNSDGTKKISYELTSE